MTFFHTAEGWLVLSTIKELCTKEIIAWDFDTGATVDLAIKTLNKITYCKNAILHSDQGGTYTSPMYMDTAESYNLVLSYSKKKIVMTMLVWKIFMGTLNQRHLSVTYNSALLFKKGGTQKKIINNYITWYNNERIQAKLNCLSPVEFHLKNYQQTVAI